MKGVKKMISILVRIISITIMKLLMLPKAKKPDHFAYKMSLLAKWVYLLVFTFKFYSLLIVIQILRFSLGSGDKFDRLRGGW
jgi:hypothetical protein